MERIISLSRAMAIYARKQPCQPFVYEIPARDEELQQYLNDMVCTAKRQNPIDYILWLSSQLAARDLQFNQLLTVITIISEISQSFTIPLLDLEKQVKALFGQQSAANLAIVFICNCQQYHLFHLILEYQPQSIENTYYTFWGLFVAQMNGYQSFETARALFERTKGPALYKEQVLFNGYRRHTAVFYYLQIAALSLDYDYSEQLLFLAQIQANLGNFQQKDKVAFYKAIFSKINFEFSLLVEEFFKITMDMLNSDEVTVLMLQQMELFDYEFCMDNQKQLQLIQSIAIKNLGPERVQSMLLK